MAAGRATAKKIGRSSLPDKRHAILDAATELFLKHGYLSASLDEIAELAVVSRQTIYAHFQSKEGLFVAVVRRITDRAHRLIEVRIEDPKDARDLRAKLGGYAERQLRAVMTPLNMQLARLVISEAARFPEFGQALYEGSAEKDVAALTATFERWRELGLLKISDAQDAGRMFNSLLMGDAIGRALMLGDHALPNALQIRRHANECVRIFLKLYGPDAR